jgi:lipoprotein-anchoring transpeptidase ErfK/SrfK
LPPDHPENILGTRWLGFAQKDGFPEAATFGIHGTKEDQTIGTESSNGCIRMHNGEVEELFEWVGAGTAVEIVP